MRVTITMSAEPEDADTTVSDVLATVLALIDNGDALVPNSEPQRWVAISDVAVSIDIGTIEYD